MKFKSNKHVALTAREDFADAVRGIRRGIEGMKAGTGKPFRQALDEIRAKYKIPHPKK